MIVNSDKIHVLFNRQKKTGSQEWGSQNKRTNHKAVFPVELLDLETDDKLSFHLLVGIICNTATNWLNTMIHLKNYRTHCVESSN